MNKIQKRVCVIGLGCIGLPTACALVAAGYVVHGVDINQNVVNRIQSIDLIGLEPDLQTLLIKALKSGRFEASTTVAPADIYIIAVPTLLGPGNQPDISCVDAAVNAMRPHLLAENLVMIESTCPIGTTDVIARKLQAMCPNIYVAYCPERVLPGNILKELLHNDRVVGGVDEMSTLQTVAFYQSFVRGDVIATDARTAEAVKLAENAFRDVNIAYANELSLIADYLGLDVNKIIRLANRHPRVHILEPGPGVGGHCIAMDPWYLVSTAPDLAALTLKAREINTRKAAWVIERVRKAVKENGASVIACLGLTYKPNVSDTRESPALTVVETLEREIEVIRVDPYVPQTRTLSDALAQAQILVGLVAHNAFQNIPPQYLADKVVLDFAGVFK